MLDRDEVGSYLVHILNTERYAILWRPSYSLYGLVYILELHVVNRITWPSSPISLQDEIYTSPYNGLGSSIRAGDPGSFNPMYASLNPPFVTDQVLRP